MITKTTTLVGRVMLGLVALAGLAAAVPASAHPYDGRGWGHERRIEARWHPYREGWGWRYHRMIEHRDGYWR